MSRAWAEVDLGAVAQNTGRLAEAVAPARLCAVVKAGAYGHGAVPVARAALDAGAAMLAVATVEEGVELRTAGLDARVLVLSEPAADGWAAAVDAEIEATVCTPDGIDAAAGAGAGGVHLKVDTGMHRIGCAPAAALGLARRARDAGLGPASVWTHLASAEDPAQDDYTAAQLDRFDEVLAGLGEAGVDPGLRHAANSAGALAHARARYDLVRCGIALYGYPPVPAPGLRPVLSLRARVSAVRRLPAGERISYGRRYELAAEATVATVPVGYADGVPRRLAAAGGEVLVGGRRRPIAGTVTMDQLMVDCGDDPVAVGDEVVLLGRQGSEHIDAEEWATLLGTISYEVLTGIGPRVPRVHR